jgi:type I restriction-modification system DNA methylase subunit
LFKNNMENQSTCSDANSGSESNTGTYESIQKRKKHVLLKTYNRLDNPTLTELLRLINSIPMDIQGDAFGKIYEYFLGNFALSEGQRGGEFFTPTCIVKLIVGIIEPFRGRIFDPACGSGGMFVESKLSAMLRDGASTSFSKKSPGLRR